VDGLPDPGDRRLAVGELLVTGFRVSKGTTPAKAFQTTHSSIA
jgi:hypothetical protein